MARHMGSSPESDGRRAGSGAGTSGQARAPRCASGPTGASGRARVPRGAPSPAEPSRAGRSRGGVARIVAGIAVFLVGAAIFLFPTVTELLARRDAEQAIDAALVADGVRDPAATDAAAAGKRDKASDPAYQWLLAYNQRVAEGQGGAINDPWGIGSDADELSDVGLADGIVGSLTISSLGEKLPLYLGAGTDHLAGGVAVISGTDVPLGQAGSNCVIAGHRAKWSGLTMFRDIENVREGDTVDIETPWDSLTYKVVGFRIIDPTSQEDIRDICAIQPGRDLVTLVTCHPYGHNYQRYVVTCERVADGQGAEGANGASRLLARNPVSEALQPSASPLLVLERWLRLAGLLLMVLVALMGIVVLLRRRSRRR